jgi:hypothetical protein
VARKLNTRQLEFAVRVAEGEPLVAAYREVYKPANAKAASVYQNAKRSAKHPGIAARIKELQVELLPAPEDMRAVYAHGLATIIQLSISSEDSRVRLRAAQWLCAEAEKREALEAEKRETLETAGTPNEGEEILSKLRALYDKVLPELEPLVEAVGDEMADGSAENLPQVAEPLVHVAAEAEAACGEDESAEPGETAAVEVSLVAEKLNPAVQYRMERIPGYFPARYRRVPIEP